MCAITQVDLFNCLCCAGEKISPLEVDAVLLAHPSVSQAVAFAAPDSKYGEEVPFWAIAMSFLLKLLDEREFFNSYLQVNAAIVLSEGAFATEEDLIEFCKKNLAAFKIPKKIFFSKDVPRTPTGKIQRRIVAEHFLSYKGS